MNEELLKNLVSERFGEPVTITSFNEKAGRLPVADGDDGSWRQYLIQSFELRLGQAKKKEIDREILEETRKFIDALKQLSDDAVLYIWQARSQAHRYSGWASREKIIYAQKISPLDTRDFEKGKA